MWPLLRSTWEGLDRGELAQRHARAKQLVEGGYGALQGWLQAPLQPGEDRDAQGALDVFQDEP